jgi:hypothetical protein
MAKVACRIVNGIAIHLGREGFDDGTGDGVKPWVRDGAIVRLKGPSSLMAGAGTTSPVLEPVINEVDGEWIAKWFAQNAKNPIVTSKMVELVDEGKGPNPTAA